MSIIAPKNTGASRLRSRGSFGLPTPITVWDVTPAGAIVNKSVVGYASPQGRMETMADVVTPGFTRAIAQGRVIFNPMNSTHQELSSASQGIRLRWKTAGPNYGAKNESSGDVLLYLLGGRCIGTETSPRLRALALSSLPIDRAIREATTKAQRSPSEADFLVTLAEMDKTRRLVPDLLNNWSKLFTKLNRVSTASRYSTAFQNSKGLTASNLRALERTLTETWLAMRFGVRPLIMDTLGLLKTVSKLYSAEPVRVTQRGKSYAEASDVSTLVAPSGVTRTAIVYTTQNIVSVRAMNLWEFKLDQLRDAGVSLAAIPEAAIDLVRFSFVVNWVINVNDFMASLGAAVDPGLRSLGGCYVVERVNTTTWQATGTTSADPNWEVERPCLGVMTATDTFKERIIGLPNPKLVVRAMPFKFLTDARLVDAVALLRQVTRGRNTRLLAAIDDGPRNNRIRSRSGPRVL